MVYPLADGTWYFDTMIVAGTIAALLVGEIIVLVTGQKVSVTGARQALATLLYKAAKSIEGRPNCS